MNKSYPKTYLHEKSSIKGDSIERMCINYVSIHFSTETTKHIDNLLFSIFKEVKLLILTFRDF